MLAERKKRERKGGSGGRIERRNEGYRKNGLVASRLVIESSTPCELGSRLLTDLAVEYSGFYGTR